MILTRSDSQAFIVGYRSTATFGGMPGTAMSVMKTRVNILVFLDWVTVVEHLVLVVTRSGRTQPVTYDS